MRLLHRLRLRGRVLERVVRPAEVDAVLGPEPVHDLELLREHLQADGRLRERKAVGAVLALHPAGAEAELDPAARDVVDRRDRVREQAGQAEGRRGDERAEPERARARRESCERRPGVVRDVAGPRSTARCSGRSGRASRRRAPRTRRRARTTAARRRPPGPRSSARRASRDSTSEARRLTSSRRRVPTDALADGSGVALERRKALRQPGPTRSAPPLIATCSSVRDRRLLVGASVRPVASRSAASVRRRSRRREAASTSAGKSGFRAVRSSTSSVTRSFRFGMARTIP